MTGVRSDIGQTAEPLASELVLHGQVPAIHDRNLEG